MSYDQPDYMRPRGPVTRVNDAHECDRLVAIASRVTEDMNMVSRGMLTRLKWAAVPVIDSITEEMEKQTLGAIRKIGVKKLYFVSTNPRFYDDEIEPQDYVYEVDLQSDDHGEYLTTTSDEFVIFPECISRYPRDNDFVLLYGAEGEHFIVAGPVDFVEEALGKSVSKARVEFQDWIGRQGSPKLGAHLQSIADRCSLFDG